jgi:tetratricopeptide (TPR) repeat protein
VALGTAQVHFDWEFPAAERTFRTALTLAPSATPAQYQLSMLLAALRRTDEAIVIAREAQQREPLVPAATMRLGTAYYYARQYDAAEAEAKRLIELAPAHPVGHFLLARVNSARGRHDEAIASMRRSLAIARPTGYLTEFARILTAAGRTAEVKAVMDEAAQREAKGEGYSLDNLAYIAAAGGRTDEAFAILNEAFERRLVNMLWLAVDPRVDPIRSDSRFATLLSRMGLQ